MSVIAGDLALLDDPLAVELLASRFPARLAYLWFDGTPRVVPIWFHWTGSELVMCSPARAPKLKALAQHPEVSVTIDSNEWPYRVLSLRGTPPSSPRQVVTAEASERRVVHRSDHLPAEVRGEEGRPSRLAVEVQAAVGVPLGR